MTAQLTKCWLPKPYFPVKNPVVHRYPLTPGEVPWSVPVPGYDPIDYTAEVVLRNSHDKSWADRANAAEVEDLHAGAPTAPPHVVDRSTCHPRECYDIEGSGSHTQGTAESNDHNDTDDDDDGGGGSHAAGGRGRPVNPWGRTGLRGRSDLGKWGVNQAVDVVVTRWKRAPDGRILRRNNKQMLEFVAIFRRPDREWAVPGGFALFSKEWRREAKRVFFAKVLAGTEQLESLEHLDFRQEWRKLIENLDNYKLVARTYSEDERNTDNAWVETSVFNVHDADGLYAPNLPLKPGTGVDEVRWTLAHGKLNLFASHRKFLERICKERRAYF